MRLYSRDGSPAVISVGPTTARGVVAIGGGAALGVVSVGGAASCGVIAIGVNAAGGLVAVGVNAAGPVALAGVNAIGALALAGVNALGAAATAAVNQLSWWPLGLLVAAVAWLVAPAALGERPRRPARDPRPATRALDAVRADPAGGWAAARLTGASATGVQLRADGREHTLPCDEEQAARASALVARASRFPRVLVRVAQAPAPARADHAGGYRDAPPLAHAPVVVELRPEPPSRFWPEDAAELAWLVRGAWRGGAVLAALIGLVVAAVR
jgi:hypothetical protein